MRHGSANCGFIMYTQSQETALQITASLYSSDRAGQRLNNDRRVPIMADWKAGSLPALSPDQDMEPSSQNRGQERSTCEAVRRRHMRVRSADTVLMS